MTDQDNPNDRDDSPELALEMTLEAPPTAAAEPATQLGGSMSGLLGDDTALLTAAKFSLVEAFLRQITRDQSFGDFLREILLASMKVVKSEAGSLLEVDHERNSIFFRSTVGTSSDRVSGFVIPMGQGIVGHVAESRRPLVVANVAENKLHLKSIQDAVGFETRNLVAVPIVIRGRIYGVLELLNRVGEPDYTPADVELLAYACEMAAKAIEARLMIAWSAKSRTGRPEGKNEGEGEAA
jgi:GAF domain-containing protein